MKKSLLILSLCAISSSQAQWSDFYARTGGTQTAGGTGNTDAPLISGTNGGFTNGVYAFSSAQTLTSDMTNHTAAFYTDGELLPRWIAWITAVDDATDSITVTRTQSKSGTEITTAANGITCNIGGAWTFGINGSTNRFPFHFLPAGVETFASFGVGLTNRQGHPVRLNPKGSGDYTVIDYPALAETTNTAQGPYWIQGFTNTVGDNGFARIGFDTNAAFSGRSPMIFSGTGIPYIRNLWSYDGGEAASGGTHNNGSWNFTTIVDFRNNVVERAWESGVRVGGQGSYIVGNLIIFNQVNAASGKAGIELANAATVRNNIIAFQEFRPGDNGADGIALVGSSSLPMLVEDNIIYRCYGTGIIQSGNGINAIIRGNLISDVTLYGINVPISTSGLTNSQILRIDNNIINTAHTGIRGNATGSGQWTAPPFITTNAFLACTNGNVTLFPTNNILGSIQLTANPWVSPTTGNFMLNTTAGGGAAVRGLAGPGFLQFGTNFSAFTYSYRDVGAVQTTNATSGGTTSYIFGGY
jgi:hypothetical protein